MSLPLIAVERLFERLTTTYGRQFLSMYEGLDPAAVKTTWAYELAGFARNLQAIAWALENLPERCPNVIEFRNLCRRAPDPETPRLPEPKADPARVAAELAKLGELRNQPKPKMGPLDWAYRIVERAKGGRSTPRDVLKIAEGAIQLRGGLGSGE